MEEILQQIWSYALPIGGGLTVGAVVTAIGSAFTKGSASKLLAKIDTNSIVEKVIAKFEERLKNFSFKLNIEPVLQSGLKKVSEEVNENLKKKYAELESKFDKVVNILEKFAVYFDDSLLATDEKKSELKEAIAEAKDETVHLPTEQIVSVTEIAETEQPKAETIGVDI